MDNTRELLLILVKYGLKKSDWCRIPQAVDWNELFELTQFHGVTAVALDGINRFYEKGIGLDIDFQTKMDWIGAVQQMEVRYHQHLDNIISLANFYKEHSIKMMLLKGYGLSLNYPIPEHRPCGDMDIYLFGEQQKGDRLVNEKLGIRVDNSHHHHTVFSFQEESVENHYDFLNVHVRKSNRPIEKKLKELAHTEITKIAEIDKINTNLTNDTNVVLPSTEFNAIYLLRHCAAHFASTELSLRQVLDWGLFMEKHHQEIKWVKYMLYIKQIGMYKFYNLMGLFCMRYFGFDASIFNGLYEDELLERFSNEILSPEFKDRENGSLLHSLSVKPRRWWHNRWKNRLCYPDGAWSEFVCGLWAKMLKPSHFVQ